MPDTPTPETPAELAALIRSFGYTTWSQSHEIAAAITDRLATLAASSTAPAGWSIKRATDGLRIFAPNGCPGGMTAKENARGLPERMLYALAESVLAAAPAAAERKPLTDEQVKLLRFLDGSGHLRGVAYGDRHPDERGNWWWRKDLRTAFPDAFDIGDPFSITAAPAGSEGE